MIRVLHDRAIQERLPSCEARVRLDSLVVATDSCDPFLAPSALAFRTRQSRGHIRVVKYPDVPGEGTTQRSHDLTLASLICEGSCRVTGIIESD